MKIMRPDGGCGDIERADRSSLDVDDSFIVLHDAGDEQEARSCCCQSLALEELRLEDDVRDAGFVFEREEDETFRGARSLASDRTPPGNAMVDGAGVCAGRLLCYSCGVGGWS